MIRRAESPGGRWGGSMIARMGASGLFAATAVAFALGAPPPASAEGGAHIANEPAATLLLPYFEVALPKKPGAKPKGVTTVFTINNASAGAALVHVTIWSDLGIPVTFFDAYLTGYDALTVDMAEVIDGRLPITADVAHDPADEISPKGFSSQDLTFPGCNGILPGPAQLPEESVEHLRTSLTGQPSPLFGNQCFGRSYGEKKPIARGYVTVDMVNNCSLLFPDQIYFQGGTASNVNQLFGDWFIVDRAKKTAYGDALVHIRADGAEFAPGNYTFYARQVAGLAADARQPLATHFAGRFVNDPKDPLFPGGTSAIAWRDVKLSQGPFDCSTTPAFYPLFQEQIVAFDDEEQVEVPQLPPIPPLPAEPVVPFPGAAQKVPIGTESFPVSFPRGWLYMNLNTAVAGAVVPGNDPAAAQAFVTMLHANKKHAVAVRGVALEDANNTSHVPISTP